MKKRIAVVIILVALCSSLLFSQQPSYDYRELNQRLFGHLESLNSKARTGRLASGGILIGMGAVSGVGGWLIAQNDGLSDGDLSRMIGYTFMGLGVLYAGIGIPTLIIPSKEERLYRNYAALPGASEREIKIKLEKGERELRDLAYLRRQQRYLSAGTSIAFGFAGVLTTGSLYSASLCGAGLAALLVESPAELEWKFYEEDKRTLTGN